ncbi:MAG: hypothetical protein LAQ69_00870 [Acidobacteriia bacterium]|nr:hypothetical protein [Terriglobia bacterium]
MKLWIGIVCSVLASLAGDASTARIQEAATRAVAIIQKSQNNWYAKASCVSCHQQVFPALAFRAAREHGIPVDEKAAHADAAAAFGFYSNLERAAEFTYVIDPALNDSYGMIAANAAGVRPSLVTAVYARLVAARQEPDGHWETGDVRPPQSYSPFTTTAITVRAIQLYGHPSQKADVLTRVARARSWLVFPPASRDRGARVPTAGRLLGRRGSGHAPEDGHGTQSHAAGRWGLELA